MPEQVLPIPGFGGGVNIVSAENQLADDQCLGLKNIILDEEGGGTKRRGITSIFTSASEIISLYIYYRGVTAAPQVMIQMQNGTVRYSDNGGTSFTDVVTGTNTSQPISWETFDGNLYFVDGSDYYKWNGTTVSIVAGAPGGKFLRSYKDSMWVDGTDDNRVYSSDPGTAETFTVGNYIDISKGDGDTVSGLATDGQVLIVTKFKRGFLIYDPVTYANRMFDPDKGCESHFSFVHWGENLYYLSRLGICVYLGDSPSSLISRNINPVFTPDILDFDSMRYAWGYTKDNRIGWTVSDNQVGDFNLQIEMLPGSEKRPFTFHRMPVRCFATYRTGSIEKLIGGKSGGTKLVECFSGATDDGTAFGGVIETKWFDLQNPFNFKYLRRLVLTASGQFYMNIYKDFTAVVQKTRSVSVTTDVPKWGEPGDVWDDENWGGSSILDVVRLHPDVYGRYFKFRFSDEVSDQGIRVVDVGDIDYQLTRGQWSLLGCIMHSVQMGTDL